MREIRMLRVMWRELETGSRTSLAGHEGGNPGYRQGLFYRVTAPALDPTSRRASVTYAASNRFGMPCGNDCIRTGDGRVRISLNIFEFFSSESRQF